MLKNNNSALLQTFKWRKPLCIQHLYLYQASYWEQLSKSSWDWPVRDMRTVIMPDPCCGTSPLVLSCQPQLLALEPGRKLHVHHNDRKAQQACTSMKISKEWGVKIYLQYLAKYYRIEKSYWSFVKSVIKTNGIHLSYFCQGTKLWENKVQNNDFVFFNGCALDHAILIQKVVFARWVIFISSESDQWPGRIHVPIMKVVPTA